MADGYTQLSLFDAKGGSIYVPESGKTLLDPATGEPVYLHSIRKPYYGQKHFWKLFIGDFLAAMGFLESKQIDVVCYILSHTSPYNNQFQGRQQDIAAGCECSEPTVRRVLKKMINANLLTKTKIQGVYLVNPSIMVQGSVDKQRGILIEYAESRDPEVIAEAEEMGALPEGNMNLIESSFEEVGNGGSAN